MGAYIQQIIMVVWLNNNLVGRTQKAVGVAIELGFGNSANFVTSNIFITTEAPKYPTGFKVDLALAVMGIAFLVAFVLMLRAENRELDRKEAAGEFDENAVDGNGGRFRNIL
jgi:hypothetical protein